MIYNIAASSRYTHKHCNIPPKAPKAERQTERNAFKCNFYEIIAKKDEFYLRFGL